MTGQRTLNKLANLRLEEQSFLQPLTPDICLRIVNRLQASSIDVQDILRIPKQRYGYHTGPVRRPRHGKSRQISLQINSKILCTIMDSGIRPVVECVGYV